MGKLLIIHYHLNPGGVTRIIESQVHALAAAGFGLPVCVLTGKCDNPQFYAKAGVELIVEEKLNYLDSQADFKQEYTYLKDFFNRHIQAGDIIHFHNLNLGKNPVLTCIMGEWVRKGFRLINHAHDFAEDRPENFRFLARVIHKLFDGKPGTLLYPEAPNYSYVVLNSSDRNRLITYGIGPERILHLPNPVVFNGKAELNDRERIRQNVFPALQAEEGKQLITYPVRVIRRKNIGEYILLCHLFKDQANWVVTQPPKNPVEVEYYEQWKQFCVEQGIPLVFEAGEKVDFEELIIASDFCFTTSIREGFGMAFMEPWLLGTPVIGRDLPDVTCDLRQSGMEFPLLYDRLTVQWADGLRDFGSLDLEAQMEYIRSLVKEPEKEKEAFQHNPFLKNLLNSINESLIRKNKATILKEYSILNYGQRLKNLYKEPS
ncbi:MAG: glycosyltransferase [Bacteroidales bacterium]|nr:glycosyltransferase [Bacteroidales bacterium]